MDPQRPNEAMPRPVDTPSPSPAAPAHMPPVSSGASPAPKSHTKLALVLLIGPTALLIATIIGYALISFIFGSTDPGASMNIDDDQGSLVRTVANVVLFLVGAVTTLAWLPGIIIGIILLAKKK